jgi:hypothetical protein
MFPRSITFGARPSALDGVMTNNYLIEIISMSYENIYFEKFR